MFSFLKEIKEDIKKELKEATSFNFNSNVEKIHIDNKFWLNYEPFDIQKNWLKLAESCEHKILLFLASRKYSKTDLLALHYPLKKILKNIDYKIIIATSTKPFGKRILGVMKEILDTEDFNNFDGLDTRFNKLNIRYGDDFISFNLQNKQPNITILSPHMISLKGNHVDLCIMDDVVGSSDKDSIKKLDKAKNFYDEMISVSSSIIILGQPVATNDLYDYVEKKANDTNKSIVVAKYPIGSIPQIDKSKEDLLKKGMTKQAYFKNYELQIIESEATPLFNFKYEGFTFDKKQWVIATLDPSNGGDDTGLAIGYKFDNMFKIKAINLKDGNNSSNIYNNINHLIYNLKEYGVKELYVECNKDFGLLEILKDNQELFHISIYGFYSKENKENAIISRFSRVKNNLIIDGDTEPIKYYNIINKSKDDLADAVGMCINFLDYNFDKLKIYHRKPK